MWDILYPSKFKTYWRQKSFTLRQKLCFECIIFSLCREILRFSRVSWRFPFTNEHIILLLPVRGTLWDLPRTCWSNLHWWNNTFPCFWSSYQVQLTWTLPRTGPKWIHSPHCCMSTPTWLHYRTMHTQMLRCYCLEMKWNDIYTGARQVPSCGRRERAVRLLPFYGRTTQVIQKGCTTSNRAPSFPVTSCQSASKGK